MKKPNTLETIAVHAADNAAASALSASEAAKMAAQNAALAAKAAAESATTIAVVATDTTWIKRSLAGIEQTLDEIEKSFVTSAQHLDVLKRIEEHEVRLNTLETSNTKLTVLLSIGAAILSLLVSLLIYHILGQG